MLNRELMKTTKTGIPDLVYQNRELRGFFVFKDCWSVLMTQWIIAVVLSTPNVQLKILFSRNITDNECGQDNMT